MDQESQTQENQPEQVEELDMVPSLEMRIDFLEFALSRVISQTRLDHMRAAYFAPDEEVEEAETGDDG